MCQQSCGIPRVWKPAILCSVCAYPNDDGFNFCQSCGFPDSSTCKPVFGGPDDFTSERLRFLKNLLDNRQYAMRVSALEKEFSTFFLPMRNCMLYTGPSDVCRFLVHKDIKGKTQVHDRLCIYLGRSGSFDCGCPRRLAWGTVCSLIGKLKSIFQSKGRGVVWDENLSIGNPAVSLEVRKYLQAVKREQAISHVPVTQAKPLFFDKLKTIIEHIATCLDAPDVPLAKRYVLLRDQAFLKLQFFAGDRAGDLGRCLVQEVRRLPDNSGLYFNHTVGKTLGDGKVNEFTIMRLKSALMCPVQGLQDYVVASREMGVDMQVGYLFRPVDPSNKQVLDFPVSSSLMYSRLKSYLGALGIDEGETPHSLRGGCAVTLAASGYGGSTEIMDHVGWFTKKSLGRYSRLERMTRRASVSNLFTQVETQPEQASLLYGQLGDTQNLSPAFP